MYHLGLYARNSLEAGGDNPGHKGRFGSAGASSPNPTGSFRRMSSQDLQYFGMFCFLFAIDLP
jgi:hypothetical protein